LIRIFTNSTLSSVTYNYKDLVVTCLIILLQCPWVRSLLTNHCEICSSRSNLITILTFTCSVECSDSIPSASRLEVRPRQQHNNSVLFHQLPGELIRIIFADVSLDVVPSVAPLIQSLLAALRLSHVSSVWRAIALAMPRLWARLDASLPSAAINELLKRSKGMPLSLCSNSSPFPADGLPYVSPAKSTQFFEIAQQFSGHWDDVFIDCYSTPDILTDRLPSLRRLTALNHLQIRHHSQDPGLPWIPIPDKIFEGATFHVRSLILSGNVFAWDSVVYRGIAELKITDTTILAHQSALHLLQSWSAFQNLRVLHLDGCPAATSVTRPPYSNELDFPNLERLTLWKQNIFCAQQFLSLIHAPKCATASITINNWGISREHSLDGLFPSENVLPTALNDRPTALRTTLCQSIQRATFSSILRRRCHTFVGKSPSGSTILWFGILKSTWHRLATLYRTPTPEDFPNVTCLDLHGITSGDIDACCTILLALSTIIELQLREMKDTQEIVGFIADTAKPACIPGLVILEFHQSELDVLGLIECLQNRNAMGCRALKRLALVQIPRGVENQDMLKELVEDTGGEYVQK